MKWLIMDFRDEEARTKRGISIWGLKGGREYGFGYVCDDMSDRNPS